MSSTATPLVSVVMPVYNGEEFLADAIRSVLTQTFQDFDFHIVNNCSKDRTLAVAQEFAAKDDRIRIHNNTEFLSVIDNHSKAFSHTSPGAKYVKLISADDWFFPNCIAELVRVAEQYPSVGMVTSYALSGSEVGWDGLPYPSTFMTGRDVCRLRLLEGLKVFGGPSASLLRADIVRKKQPFYNPRNYHGDNEAYLELLRDHDFGFVHQVLSYKRKGEKSRTTAYLDRVHSYPAADVDELTKFGPDYLSESELHRRLRTAWSAYYGFLGASIFELRGWEFWHYHLKHFTALGHSISYPRLALHGLYRLADVLFNPLRTIQGIGRRLTAVARQRSRAPLRAPAAPMKPAPR